MWQTRLATISDLEAILPLRAELWPETQFPEHLREIEAIVTGSPPSTMPLALVVAHSGGDIIGLGEVGLRSHAEGCDTTRPCGYLEGWIVRRDHRRRGVGRALVAAAERWAADRGAAELASDTALDNRASQEAHAALGFKAIDRAVHYRKSIAP